MSNTLTDTHIQTLIHVPESARVERSFEPRSKRSGSDPFSGMDYTISVTQNKIRRLPQPYASKCTDYLGMGWKETFYGYLDQNVSCVQRALTKCYRF